MDNIKKTIGTKINKLLALYGNKQKDLAAHLGVTDNTISYFVSGKRCPNIEQIIKIAKYFNVTTDYLFGLSDVSSTDVNMQMVCKYTGLSEDTIFDMKCFPMTICGNDVDALGEKRIIYASDVLNALLPTPRFSSVLRQMYFYLEIKKEYLKNKKNAFSNRKSYTHEDYISVKKMINDKLGDGYNVVSEEIDVGCYRYELIREIDACIDELAEKDFVI